MTPTETPTETTRSPETLAPPPAGTPIPDVSTPEAAARAVVEFAERLAAVKTTTQGGNALDEYFASLRLARESKHRIDGLLVAPTEVFDKLEQRDREEFDATLRVEAAALLKDADAIGAALDRLAEAAHELRPPRPATVEGRALLRTAELLEREELRRQFNGRPLAELERAYQSASDDDAPALVQFVEAEVLRNFQTLSPRTTEPADHDALRRLLALMRERRAARVPLIIREHRARLNAVWTQTTRTLLRGLRTASIATDRGRARQTR